MTDFILHARSLHARSQQVGESLKRFGLSPKSTSLLLVKFSAPSADPTAILQSMLDVVAPQNLTVPPSADTTDADVDQPIRFGRYLSAASESTPPVTDWKELNKIYKLQIPSTLLSDSTALVKGEPWQKAYEEIISTSVAMKLVAA